jgi:hypothetical protein
MQVGKLRTRNDVEFRSYKKFAADARITFEPH